MTTPNFSPANSLAFNVPEAITFSKDQEQFLKQLTSAYQQLAKAINGRDIASYDLVELINGQTFPPPNPVPAGLNRENE